jgi:DNA-binding NarL/FixJ family response regulator
MKTMSTVLVQKNKALQEHLGEFLEQAGIRRVTFAGSLSELKQKVSEYMPRLILLDIYFAGEEFPAFVRELRRTLPESKVVLTGPEPQGYYARHTLAMGVDLYLSDGLEPDEWIRRLKAIATESSGAHR